MVFGRLGPPLSRWCLEGLVGFIAGDYLHVASADMQSWGSSRPDACSCLTETQVALLCPVAISGALNVHTTILPHAALPPAGSWRLTQCIYSTWSPNSSSARTPNGTATGKEPTAPSRAASCCTVRGSSADSSVHAGSGCEARASGRCCLMSHDWKPCHSQSCTLVHYLSQYISSPSRI